MLTFSEIQTFKSKLPAFYQTETERCGVILADGQIVERENLASDPANHFQFRLEDLEGAVATWHTHPKSTGNLSIDDYYFFKSWPSQTHFIISFDGIWCYLTDELNRVIQVDVEEDYPPRPFGRKTL